MWKDGATSSAFVSEEAEQLSPSEAVTLMVHEFSSGMNRNPFWGHTTLASISLPSLLYNVVSLRFGANLPIIRLYLCTEQWLAIGVNNVLLLYYCRCSFLIQNSTWRLTWIHSVITTHRTQCADGSRNAASCSKETWENEVARATDTQFFRAG